MSQLAEHNIVEHHYSTPYCDFNSVTIPTDDGAAVYSFGGFSKLERTALEIAKVVRGDVSAASCVEFARSLLCACRSVEPGLRKELERISKEQEEAASQAS